MTLQEIYETWSNQTPDNEDVLEKLDEMALHFPVPPGEDMTEDQQKEYFSNTFYIPYLLPYVRSVERQAFIAAFKQAFQLFTELLKEKEKIAFVLSLNDKTKAILPNLYHHI